MPKGETIEEIRENIIDAIEEYLHAQKVLGAEIGPPVAEKFEVSIG